MVEELICAGIQCMMQNGEKVLEGILQIAQNFSFGPGRESVDRKNRES